MFNNNHDVTVTLEMEEYHHVVMALRGMIHSLEEGLPKEAHLEDTIPAMKAIDRCKALLGKFGEDVDPNVKL